MFPECTGWDGALDNSLTFNMAGEGQRLALAQRHGLQLQVAVATLEGSAELSRSGLLSKVPACRWQAAACNSTFWTGASVRAMRTLVPFVKATG